ncbi:MAG: hypothetical protein V3T83_08655, partial [Acidobacteriota bacterium]
MVFLALVLQPSGEVPRLAVVAGPEQVRRLPDVTFKRRSPPAGLREDAMTRCLIEIRTEVPSREAGFKWMPGSCLAEAHVDEVRIRLALKIQVFLPKGAPRVLRAHEEGHARVCKEAFEKMAEALARRTYRAFPSHFGWRSGPDCSAVEMQKRTYRALGVLDAGLAQIVQQELIEVLNEGTEMFDRLTRNGLSDTPKGSASSVRGQRRAAQETIRKLFSSEK